MAFIISIGVDRILMDGEDKTKIFLKNTQFIKNNNLFLCYFNVFAIHPFSLTTYP